MLFSEYMYWPLAFWQNPTWANSEEEWIWQRSCCDLMDALDEGLELYDLTWLQQDHIECVMHYLESFLAKQTLSSSALYPLPLKYVSHDQLVKY